MKEKIKYAKHGRVGMKRNRPSCQVMECWGLYIKDIKVKSLKVMGEDE